ncbi:MAG: DUF2905 domain-containing protein [Parvularcula sp.]|jgi:hypothetical protein|nr:DUF2905 domain-containing protein [Parvularcula sp.]
MQKILLILGALFILAGLLWPWLSQLGLGRLPGDVVIERGPAKIYIPIVTCLVLSVGLTLVLRLFSGR